MEWILKESTQTNWLTILVLFNFVLIVAARQVNSLQFSDFSSLFNTNKYFILHQKNNNVSSFFNVLFITAQILSVSVFCYLAIRAIKVPELSETSWLFAKIMTFYGLIVICKILIEKILGTLFSIEPIIEDYLLYKVTYRNYYGLILFPINLILIYAFKPDAYVFYMLIFLLLAIHLILLLTYYKKNENLILNNLFYFILYLCALEIAPYYILYKLLL